MSQLGYPKLPSPGRTRYARLCLVAAIGHPMMITVIGAESDGDLRAVYALQMGLRADQVVLRELQIGGVYVISDFLLNPVKSEPILLSTCPPRWSDEED